jgi:hypothetical protein
MDDDLTVIAKDTRRVAKDTRAAVSNLDSKLDRLDRFIDGGNARRDGSLVTRLAACHLVAKAERSTAVAVAARNWPHDIELRAAVAPAQTGVAGWASELVGSMVDDVSSSVLGPSVFGQLRALGVSLISSTVRWSRHHRINRWQAAALSARVSR